MRVSKEAEMETLSRWAASLAMAGGAVFVVVLLIVAFSPTSPVWYGFLVGIVLLGAAVVGLYRPRDEVLAAEPPRPHDMTGKTFLGLGYRWTAHFAEVPGGMEVRLDPVVILPLHLIGRAIRRFVAPATVRSRMEHRLALLAESVGGESPETFR